MEKKISISQIKEVAQQAYNEVKGQTGGKNADYIPYLANIDSKLFGLSICLMNGRTINIGDTDYRFGIESVSKVHTAILILRQYGAQKVLDMIGADATGLPFNSIIARDAIVQDITEAGHPLRSLSTNCTNRKRLRTSITAPLHGY